jgi:hypothetical protein
VRRVDLWPALDADLLQDGDQLLAETPERVVGLPHINHAEAGRTLSRCRELLTPEPVAVFQDSVRRQFRVTYRSQALRVVPWATPEAGPFGYVSTLKVNPRRATFQRPA